MEAGTSDGPHNVVYDEGEVILFTILNDTW